MRAVLRLAVALAAAQPVALALSACGDSGTTDPGRGTAEVSVTVTGEGSDDDGFQVIVDSGLLIFPVDEGAPARIPLDAGPHSLEIADLDAGCAVSGQDLFFVDITAGGTASVTFAVNCRVL